MFSKKAQAILAGLSIPATAALAYKYKTASDQLEAINTQKKTLIQEKLQELAKKLPVSSISSSSFVSSQSQTSPITDSLDLKVVSNIINTISQSSSHIPPATAQLSFAGGFPGASFLNQSFLTYSIIATNLAVFLAWNVDRLSYVMQKHFTSSTDAVFNQKRYHTLITSAFSHATPMHFLFNNLALYSILPQLERIWGVKKTASIYLGSAVVSTGMYLGVHRMIEIMARKTNRLTPVLYNALRTPSLGASGVIASLFVCYANMFPQSKFAIMFIPYPIDALSLMTGFALFDLAGFCTMLYRGYGFMNLCHTAHLSGYLTGLLIYKFADPFNSEKRRKSLQQRQSQRW